MSTEFAGFPRDVFRFYEELHENNDRDWFKANKERYERVAKGPMDALLQSFEGLYGERRLFRPYRDVRFSKDKRPIKESIAGLLGMRVGGYYLSLNRDGLHAGAGVHGMPKETLETYRRAVDGETAGNDLVVILADLESAKYNLSQPDLKRVPRGYDPEHPRGDLLKLKSLVASRDLGKPSWLHKPEGKDRILELFVAIEPLIAWIRAHLS